MSVRLVRDRTEPAGDGALVRRPDFDSTRLACGRCGVDCGPAVRPGTAAAVRSAHFADRVSGTALPGQGCARPAGGGSAGLVVRVRPAPGRLILDHRGDSY